MMADFDAFRPDVVANAVTQPPLADLAQRATRRTRRRVAVAGTGVAGLLSVSIVAVGSLLTSGSAPTEVPAVTVAMVPFDRQTVVSVQQNDCAVAFRLTTDGGRTWTSSRGPTPWRGCGLSTKPPTRYQVLGERLYDAEVDGQRYVSRDAGATWQPWNGQVTSIDAFPVEAALRDCESGCGNENDQVVDPDGGGLRQLSFPPPLSQRWMMRVAPDGGLWVLGTNTTQTGPVPPPQVVFSTDRGLSWAGLSTLPEDLESPTVIPVAGLEAYVLGYRAGQAILLRTTDGFATWTEHPIAPLAAIAASGRPAIGVAITGGELVICGWNPAINGNEVWAIGTIGEYAIGPDPVLGPPGACAGSAAARLLWTVDDSATVHLTTDGRTWKTVSPPPP